MYYNHTVVAYSRAEATSIRPRYINNNHMAYMTASKE